MTYGVRSRISLYCIRRRMARLRMRVALLPLTSLRLTPGPGISKNNAVFIWDTRLYRLNMTTIATTSVFHILLESNRLFMRNQT